MLVVTLAAAKGLATDLEVAGSGPVSCSFFIPFSFLPYMCGSLACLSEELLVE